MTAVTIAVAVGVIAPAGLYLRTVEDDGEAVEAVLFLHRLQFRQQGLVQQAHAQQEDGTVRHLGDQLRICHQVHGRAVNQNIVIDDLTTAAGTTFTGGYQFARQNANLFQGWTNDPTADAAHLDTDNDNNLDADKAYRDYLGTGAMTDEAALITTGTSSNHSYVLYTMPNSSATATTRLVIKASYNSTDYYYPIELLNNVNGNVSTDAKIYPNRNYVVDVIIKGVGANTPFEDVGVQQTTQSNVNVVNWSTSTNDDNDFDPNDWD